jgi:hypothetical protein
MILATNDMDPLCHSPSFDDNSQYGVTGTDALTVGQAVSSEGRTAQRFGCPRGDGRRCHCGADGEVRSLGTIPNRADSLRKLIQKLGPVEKLRACYEAGPTGYVVYWQLAELGVKCVAVASTLVPVKAGDRVKTDRLDAEKLARCYRSGDLTAVWVPDRGSEALRDLVRAREAAKQDQLRARHRLSKFLLRSGQRPPSGIRPWTRPYLIWVAQLRFNQMAQEATLLDYLHEVELSARTHKVAFPSGCCKEQESVGGPVVRYLWLLGCETSSASDCGINSKFQLLIIFSPLRSHNTGCHSWSSLLWRSP